MSGQYLEAHAFLKTLRDKGVPYTETLVNLMQYAVIEEVAPVVHGSWIKEEDCTAITDIPWSMCSVCGCYSLKLPYCAFCGAKMDKKEEGKE